VLTGQEYSSLRGRARAWTASADRALPELVEAFGPPSWWRPNGADYPAARTADSMQSADARGSGGCPVQSGFVAWSPTAIQLPWDG
jgi:hypothetical protein